MSSTITPTPGPQWAPPPKWEYQVIVIRERMLGKGIDAGVMQSNLNIAGQQHWEVCGQTATTSRTGNVDQVLVTLKRRVWGT